MPAMIRFTERRRRARRRAAAKAKAGTAKTGKKRSVQPKADELPKRDVTMTVLAQDPSVLARGRKILRATVTMPAERLERGPRGHRFFVVDYDASAKEFTEPRRIEQTDDLLYQDPFAGKTDRQLLDDPGFHAQNVFAIAARTLESFESALGRRVPWSFPAHQLYLVPHAFDDANAYYAEDDHAVYFGYYTDDDGKRVNTCLSHDVVAHEITHAILDGLRNRYQEPGLPDQDAFHEAFADIVALLSAFAVPGLIAHSLGRADEFGRISSERVTSVELGTSVLLALAEQLGRSIRGTDEALRESVKLPANTAWMTDPEFDEPHRRGEVLVAAMMKALLAVWDKRLQPLIISRQLSRERAAEEGATASRHLLQMAIRCIDYCPPLEFEFEDFLDALITSDREMNPDDKLGYRDAITAAFKTYGIVRPRESIVDLSVTTPTYHGFNYVRLRTDVDEVFRFFWENHETLGIDPQYFTRIENLRASQRVGPDGFVIEEAIVDYVQTLEGRPAQIARKLKVKLPKDLPKNRDVQVRGAGVLVFDQFGRAKYHQHKRIDDADRQRRRLEYLLRSDRRDTQGRFGFSTGAGRGARFAEAHRPRSVEEW